MLIGLVGPIASGKGVVGEYLVKKKFHRYTLSDEVREEAMKLGIVIRRKELQDLGNEMRQTHGEGYWAKIIVEKTEIGKDYVIDGIRNPGEVAVFRALKDFVLVGVDAPIEVRLQRITQRNKDSDPRTLEEIRLIERRDRGIGEQKHGQQVQICYDAADFFIYNNGSVEDVEREVEKILRIVMN